MDKNKKTKILYLTLLAMFFIFGWFLNSVISTLEMHKEKPSFGNEEKPSSYDRITEEQLQLLPDKLIISLPELKLAYYTDTNSMNPLIDEQATGIEITPRSEGDIHVGDVVAYESGNDLIPHRVISISEDAQGWYALVKGDNSDKLEKIRFEQVKYILIGVLY